MNDTFENGVFSAPHLANRTTDELLLLACDGENGFQGMAMESLCAMSFENIAPYLVQAVRNDGNADLRNGAMDIIVRFGAFAVPRLTELLGDENEEIRNFSAVMLGYIGDNEAVLPLCRALKDPEANVRHGAAEALGKIADRRALFPLVGLLRGDCWDKFYAVAAIGDLGDERAVPFLLEFADDENVKDVVVAALSRLCSSQEIQSITSVVDNFVDQATKLRRNNPTFVSDI